MVQKYYLVLHLVLVAGSYQPREAQAVSSQEITARSLTQSQKFEQCVKIVAMCRLIWDSPPEYGDFEYEDNDEELNEDLSFHGPDYFYGGIKVDYRKAKCIPPGLSKKELEKFWLAVAEWETEVKNLFLVEKFVPILKEYDNAIKIDLWGMLHLRKTVTCYRSMKSKMTPQPTTTTTTATTTSIEIASTTISPSTAGCNANTEIGIWINHQINGTLGLHKLIKKLSPIVDKLERHERGSCCPYEPVRDRVEVVHDGIDFILEFHSIEPYKRAQSTGFMGSDFDNLKRRLEYLSLELAKGAGRGNRSVGKCCPAWPEQFKTFQVEMAKHVEKLGANTSILDTAALTNKQKDLEMISSGQMQIIQKLEALHSTQAAEITEDCCKNNEKIVENIEKLLEGLKSSDALGESKNEIVGSLQEKLTKTNGTLTSTESFLIAEEANIRKITSLCGDVCPSQKKQRLGQQSTSVSLLEEQVDQMNNKVLEIVDLLESLNWAAHLRSISQVRQRLNDFTVEQKQIDVNLAVISEEPSDESLKELTLRLNQLEVKLNGLRPKNQTYEQLLLDRLGGLEQHMRDRLGELNARIKKTEADAKKCNTVCDWGELPTMAELQKRVKAMAASP